ncbi:synaptonemal complex central element protein 1 [Stigmatopora nigra]
MEGEGIQEPKIEQLRSKLIKLQQVKDNLEGEIMEKKILSECLQKELAALETEAYELDMVHQENKRLMQKLEFRCEESERECLRLAEQNRNTKEVLEQYRCEIQEFKLKSRKLRMKFENQLVQLIGQHKRLYSTIKDSVEQN